MKNLYRTSAMSDKLNSRIRTMAANVALLICFCVPLIAQIQSSSNALYICRCSETRIELVRQGSPGMDEVKGETISRKNLSIDLGDDLLTEAQLTYPSEGNGPFPGVLIVHGSGSTDMDGFVPAEVSGIGKPVKHYLIFAEYLSERGFAVLRYNKRGVGLKGITLDKEVVLNKTVQQLQEDAVKALATLMQQEEVDTNDITLIGRSEGSIIVTRMARKNPRVKNIVLMGGGAHNLYHYLHYQTIDRNVHMFQSIDQDHDGLISIKEIEQLPPDIIKAMVLDRNEEQQFKPIFDRNKDNLMSINDELKPLWIRNLKQLTTTEFPVSKWYQSHFKINSTLDMIGKVTANILILHGEEDRQGPVSDVRLLDEELSRKKHPDHTLITYPDLGHTFYPVDGWLQPYGPPEEKVLKDLVSWLKSPARAPPKVEPQ